MEEWHFSNVGEKPNNISVTKLRAILLLKVDFNTINKIIFNTRCIPTLETQDIIPKEYIRERRRQSAIHMAINKKLLADITNQIKKLYTTMCIDISNCFDRVAHPFVGMAF